MPTTSPTTPRHVKVKAKASNDMRHNNTVVVRAVLLKYDGRQRAAPARLSVALYLAGLDSCDQLTERPE